MALPVKQLEKALDGDVMFDGSSIEGFVRIEESDMYLKPDLDTFTLIPWQSEYGNVARLICDVYLPNGKPFPGDPRGNLKRIIKEAEDAGFVMNAGPEPEFYLFERDAGRPADDGVEGQGRLLRPLADRPGRRGAPRHGHLAE